MATPRIIFSTASANDQGGIIPNDVIDFSRFNKNPVCIKQHNWNADPIGMWTDIKFDGKNWSGVPVFHGLTPDSVTTKTLYEKGFLRAASIGGDAIWKTDISGQYALDADGNRICTKFILYEISIVTLPSNADAVQEGNDLKLAAVKIYEAAELEKIGTTITKLSSKFNNNNNMAETNTPVQGQPAAAGAPATPVTTTAAAPENSGEHITLKTADLPGFLGKIIGTVKSAFGSKEDMGSAAPTPQDTPESEQQTDKNITTPQPKPIGLSAKDKAKSKLDKAKAEVEKATEKAKAAKEKAEKTDATDADKEAYEKAKEEAKGCMKACEEAEKAYNDADDDSEDDEEAAKGGKKGKTTNAANPHTPVMKTTEELRTQVNLVTAPKPLVLGGMNVKPFSQLKASKDENDIRLLGRVMTAGSGKNISDYRILLDSILADDKFKAIVDKTRVLNVSEGQINSFRQNPQISNQGGTLQQLAAELHSGIIRMSDRAAFGAMKNVTKLSTSDDALAAPALNTVEWLTLAIFRLFPSTSWKNDIPIFGAQITGENTGIIWANIAADPAVYRGSQPVTPTDYTYSDDAVSLALVPYWLQPMRWTPLTMHQLRYDQMGTGWAQAFAKWNAIIDDNLIYTLASTVPAASIIKTTGLSGYQTTPKVFKISGATDPNSFYYNPAFTTGTGSLIAPSLNDVVSLEQIYNKQNFMLETEKATLITDPTMQAFLDKDPETKSLLTRWVNSEGGSFPKFKNTVFSQRSRVAIYDPATSQVKDPNSAIPSTAISAALGFIPSQVGMGLGKLDVFMIQDPTNYGYKMSADIRIGITPLRKNFNGTSLLTYDSQAGA